MQKFLYLICVALVALLQIALLPSASAAERAIDKEIVVPANVDAAWTAWTTRRLSDPHQPAR